MEDPWKLEESQFPREGPLEARIWFALRYAILAPSSHNSQPWRFAIADDTVTLMADRTRALPVVDPYDRELIISCGAALFNLRAALSHFGMRFAIDLFPVKADADLLASVRVIDAPANDEELARLCAAIPLRATNRGPFSPIAVPDKVCKLLVDAVTIEGVDVSAVTSATDRGLIAGLIARADQAQFTDTRFRRELASWIHPTRSGDGMPAYALGVPRLLDFENAIAGMAIRTFDMGDGVAADHAALIAQSPLLVCLSTTADNPEAWLFAGQALERLLLTARLEGYEVSYLNQPIELPALRDELAQVLGSARFPQLLLRVGRGEAVEHSPRRPLGQVAS